MLKRKIAALGFVLIRPLNINTIIDVYHFATVDELLNRILEKSTYLGYICAMGTSAYL